jgi:hypothetical protein
MVRLLRVGTAAVLVGAVAVFGFIGTGSKAANALCPKTCLTTGTVVGAGVLGGASAESSRTYNYIWTAVDLTELPPEVHTISVHLDANGYTSAGAFHGTGYVYLQSELQYYESNSVYVRVDDNGKTVKMSGGGFTLVATGPLGTGAAQWKTTYDQNWEYCDC